MLTHHYNAILGFNKPILHTSTNNILKTSVKRKLKISINIKHVRGTQFISCCVSTEIIESSVFRLKKHLSTNKSQQLILNALLPQQWQMEWLKFIEEQTNLDDTKLCLLLKNIIFAIKITLCLLNCS